jgi:LysR family transcriptional regulator, glycine cleavage system transcriptional activator
MKRFNLPPLDLIPGFEAAARTLSFTKAAEELSLTQSAVSRQIRALEDNLGVALFERHIRALTLTNEGRRLQRTVGEVLATLQETTNRIRADANTRHLTVTTTGGFASLWLIPRLARFTALHPDVDVRIQATYVSVPLDRGAADVAVRYARHDAVPAEAVRLFGEEVTLVCAPALMTSPRRLRTLKDLAQHTLLHLDTAHGILDWETWLTAEGLGSLKPAASLRFDNYEQLIQAARMGQGVALGIKRLVEHLIAQGELVVPFGQAMVSQRSYYVLRAPSPRPLPHIDAFTTWLKAEAEACLAQDAQEKPARRRVSSRRPAAPSSGAGRPARSRP